MFTGLNISPVKRARVYEYRVTSRVVGKPYLTGLRKDCSSSARGLSHSIK
jgi:hypothetical protein